MLQYISRPEFGLYEHSCNTTEKSTINYATENAVLSLCSMNIAKNHWVYISLELPKLILFAMYFSWL